MRCLLLSALLLFLSLDVLAQAKPVKSPTSSKVIPGVRKEAVINNYGGGPERTRVAFSGYNPNTFIIIDIAKGSIRELPRMYNSISPDCRWEYQPFIKQVKREDGSWTLQSGAYLAELDGPRRDTIAGDYFLFGMDEASQFIGSKITVGGAYNSEIGGLTGLYKIDRKTGLPAATLRSDTVFKVGIDGLGRGGYGGPEEWILRPGYLVIRLNNYRIKVIPFNNDAPAYCFYSSDDGKLLPQLMDDNNIYVQARVQHNNYGLRAFSRHDGRQLAQRSFPGSGNYESKYAVGTDRLYRCDVVKSMLYTEIIRDSAFVTVDSLKLVDLSLPKTQNWALHLCKGPSLLITPLDRDAAEADGPDANTAAVVSLATGKVSLRIAPFYIRTGSEIATASAQHAAYLAAYEAGKPERERKEREAAAKLCAERWNVTKYRKGLTRKWEEVYVILESYDCTKDVYRFFRPVQPADIYSPDKKPSFATAEGKVFRSYSYESAQQYHTCDACDGEGRVLEETTTTRTKELPWGYFSGIETRSTRTTTRQEIKSCGKCGGRGIVLK